MRFVVWSWLLCVLAGAAVAQVAGFEELDLRVTSLGPAAGSVVIDRGSRDGVALGDLVRFNPREGWTFVGNVVELDERSARVELRDPSVSLPVGTRGQVRIRARAVEAPPSEPAPQVPEHPPWESPQEPWPVNRPLLSQVRTLRPEQRPMRITGRAYAIADQYLGSGGRADSFFRGGVALWAENPFGRGGTLEFDAEQAYRYARVPDPDGENATAPRLDRFSYAWGGSRFESDRQEAGRFLQFGVPEFGVLDGYEWGRRLESGHRFGGSIGFMPEPDADYESGHDFQISGYYQWVADTRELFSATAGFQHSWHHGTNDRDLLVGKLQYLPPEGWNFHSTAWVDLYTSGDQAKGSGAEVTQAYVSGGHAWEGGNSIHVSYSHMAFPEIDREEFLPVLAEQLADDHSDRVALSGWRRVSRSKRMHASLGAWIDEDEAGGDAELGLELEDWLQERSRTDATLFSTLGEFSTVHGARFTYGRYLGAGRWDAMYEVGFHEQAGFTEAVDDVLQHRLRGSREFHSASGWDLSVYAEGRFWEDEGSAILGLYLQRSF